ncbi:MAG TPA: hypothetical protein VJJ77_02860, partial [Dongiaceae bacterium]|nr:hypothetical protein [Dongiaceae bacterium]
MQQIDAAALAAGAPPPAFGAEVMAMIKRLGKIVGEQGAKLAALKPAVEVSIDEAAIKKKILDEEERRRKEEEELRRKIQEEQDRLKEERERAERERQRVQDELDRRNKDKRYRDRREREERQAQRERDIRERQDKLKERAENLDQQQKDLDKEDQNFREIEDEFKKDDPNCRSSACQNIRRLRAELQAERTQLAKDQTGLQKDAQQFNKDVEKWQADARELEDLKNQGYGMNDAERKARAADQRVQQIQAQLDEIKRQKQDLRRQANWMQAEGGIGDSDAQRLRNQMQGLNGAADSLNESLGNARADAVQANAEALGMGDAYQDALNAYQQDYPGERPTYTHNLRGGLGDRMAEEQRLRGASTESLTESAGRWQQASDAYGQAINDLENIKGQIGQPGVVPTSGNALAQADELAKRLGEIQDQLKNTAYGQKFMGQSDFRAAVKAGTGAAQKMAGAESTLRDLGDTDYLGPNVSNRSQDDPLEFRSPAELERAHSFSFTGPAALRGDVMTARGVLESATQDFLGALDQQAAIQKNSPAWQQAEQLKREAADIENQLRGLAPAATVDLIGQQVGLFNASLQNGLPLGADGHIDQKAVVNGVGQIANAQARLVQTGAQLEQLGAGAAAQRQAVQAEQERVVGELAQLGVQGKLVDGKFAPAPLTEGAAMMWNMARDQTLKTFEQIERNRQQVAGADGGGTVSTELTPPNRAGPGRLTGQLANQDRALDGMAPSVAAAQAQAGAPPVDPAVRVAQLESARGALESNIGALDRQIATLPVTSAPALALASVRHALDGAKRGVESALAEEADKARAAEHVGQLRTARAGLEQQIAVLDGALADMDY